MRKVNTVMRVADEFSESHMKIEGGNRTKGIFKENISSAPLVTVITVTFNSSKTLENTIKSVISQKYDNYEYIIIDGGSSDGTLEIVDKYSSFIAYWLSAPDNGIYDAMNKGISFAYGEWIALLNSDDVYMNDDVLSKLATQNDKVSVIATDVVMMTDEGEKVFSVNTKRPLYRNIPYMHTGLFIRHSVYRQLGVYDTKYSIASDIEYIFRMLSSGIQINCLDYPLVKMRDDGASAKYFKHGRKEYRLIYMAYGGNAIMAAYGYWYTLAEKKLYDITLVRKIFRSLKGLLR
jgi:glycosyltransferase involved in cell wall biosynthesis